jgi:hypothetical protein
MRRTSSAKHTQIEICSLRYFFPYLLRHYITNERGGGAVWGHTHTRTHTHTHTHTGNTGARAHTHSLHSNLLSAPGSSLCLLAV